MDQKTLKTLLRYEPETGNFYWLPRTPEMFTNASRYPPERDCKGWNKKYAGKLAGHTAKNGYVQIRLNPKCYLAHRLAWLYAYGRDPECQIDHINHSPGDNRIVNLRECSQSQNNFNQRKRAWKTIGAKCVFYAPKLNKTNPWLVQLSVNGRLHYVGYFPTEAAAVQAHKKAAKRLHGKFAQYD